MGNLGNISGVSLKWRLGASVFRSQYFAWELELPSNGTFLAATTLAGYRHPADTLRTYVDVWDDKVWDLNLIKKALAGERCLVGSGKF